MREPVVLKSNRYGLRLILDPEIPFDALLVAVAEKFFASADFFKGAKLGIGFEGRQLSPEEGDLLVAAITANAEISVVCIVDTDPVYADRFKRQLDAFYRATEGREGEVFWGNLSPGDTLSSEKRLVLVGDVPAGATVCAQGSVVIMGSLQGSVQVGGDVPGEQFVAALEMDPERLQIGELVQQYEKKSVKPRRLRRKEKERTLAKVTPVMAVIAEGTLVTVKIPDRIDF